jgi:hypothetical protein
LERKKNSWKNASLSPPRRSALFLVCTKKINNKFKKLFPAEKMFHCARVLPCFPNFISFEKNR